ncbi:MAG: phasin family protein [Acetobacteraceae bacterium]
MARTRTTPEAPAVGTPLPAGPFGCRDDAPFEAVNHTADAFLTFQRGNLDAFLQAGRTFAEGMQSLSARAADQARRRLEATVTLLQALPSLRSPHDAAVLQARWARSLADAGAEATSLSQASAQLALE